MCFGRSVRAIEDCGWDVFTVSFTGVVVALRRTPSSDRSMTRLRRLAKSLSLFGEEYSHAIVLPSGQSLGCHT